MKCFVILAFSVLMLAVSSKPSGDAFFGDETVDQCSEMSLITCFLPFVAFAFSDEAAALTPQRAQGVLTRPQYDKLCDLGTQLGTCFRDFAKQCVPKNLTDVHTAAAGSLELLSFCNDTSMFPKAQELFRCAHTMESTHNRCADQRKQSAKSAASTIDTGNPLAALKRENSLRDLCCQVKAYELCYMPEVEGKCGQQSKPVHEDFHRRIYSAFKCSDHLASCPA